MTFAVRADSVMDEKTVEAAIQWHAASLRSDCDWEQFSEWLEALPAHRTAYDEIALLDDQLARHRSALARLVPVETSSTAVQRRVWWGVAAAASVVLVAFVTGWPGLPSGATASRSYQASANQARTVILNDGSQVVLAPGSTMQVAGRQQDRIALQGTGYFDVRHNPDRSLVVTAGSYRVNDIGTRFEIVEGGAELKVLVAEGAVAVSLPGLAQPAEVRAGQRLLVSGKSIVAEYASIVGTDVAGWRDGRLVFHNEPLSMVVLQLSRHAGVAVTVDPVIADRRFSGVLTIGDGSELVAGFAQIMGLVGQREGNSVHLSAAAVGGQ